MLFLHPIVKIGLPDKFIGCSSDWNNDAYLLGRECSLHCLY